MSSILIGTRFSFSLTRRHRDRTPQCQQGQVVLLFYFAFSPPPPPLYQSILRLSHSREPFNRRMCATEEKNTEKESIDLAKMIER